jgi:hypothetical protein
MFYVNSLCCFQEDNGFRMQLLYVKVKLSLYLIKHYAMKTYGGMEL